MIARDHHQVERWCDAHDPIELRQGVVKIGNQEDAHGVDCGCGVRIVGVQVWAEVAFKRVDCNEFQRVANARQRVFVAGAQGAAFGRDDCDYFDGVAQIGACAPIECRQPLTNFKPSSAAPRSFEVDRWQDAAFELLHLQHRGFGMHGCQMH